MSPENLAEPSDSAFEKCLAHDLQEYFREHSDQDFEYFHGNKPFVLQDLTGFEAFA